MRVAPWITLFPGMAIAITVLGLNLAGDGLRDVLDPSAALIELEGGIIIAIRSILVCETVLARN